MEDFYQVLEAELKELITRAEEEILLLETSPDDELLNSLFRAVHTIKGTSGMVDLKKIESLSHSLESLFSGLRSGDIKINGEVIEIIFHSIDKLKEIIYDLANESTHQIEPYIEIIEQHLKISSSEFFENSAQEESYEKYIQLAKENGKSVALVECDLCSQKFTDLKGFTQFLEHNNMYLFERELLEDELNEFEGSKAFHIPYRFVVLHDDIEKYLNTIKLKYTKIVYLHTKPKPQVNAQSTEGYRNTFLKISTSYIDELLNVAGEAVIARNQLLEILNYEEDSEEEIRINRLSQYINVIYNRLMKIRLLKIGSIYPRLQRIIRDVSKELNKEIQAEFYGNEIEFDEAMMEGITEALMHILRNSIDHGIENKEERIRNNKPAFGKIILNTYLQRGNIFIQVRDDGRGIDLDKIKDKALRENLYTFEQLEAMQDSEIYELIFHPGFTTRKEATSISGRGVGMDIVLNNFKKYGGSVRVESEKGKGVCITGIIPQTLSVMPAFIILVNDKKFAIMQKNILELTKYDAANIIELDDKKIYKLRNQKIPLIELNNVLFPNYMVHEKNENIAILQSENKYFAISFNSLVSIEEIVLKPLPEQVRDVNLFGGHTYSGDGSIILIIEPDAILKKFNLKVELKEGLVKKEESKNKRDHNYLFFIISDEIFFLPAVNIVGVREIGLSNIKQVLGKEKVYIEEKIITIIRIEKYLNIRKQNDIPKMYCIELKNEEYSIGIIAHDILDILEGIETYKSQDIYNQYISAYSKIEDSIALHIDIEKVVQKFIEEEISI